MCQGRNNDDDNTDDTLLAIVAAQLTVQQETEVTPRLPLRLKEHSSNRNQTREIVSWV